MSVATRPAAAYATRRAWKVPVTAVVSSTRGRRRPGAPAQPPGRPRADGRRLRELRERQLLGLRVHAHVRPRRARGRGRRPERRRSLARERVAAARPGSPRGGGGGVVALDDPGGGPEPPGEQRAL